MMKVQICSASVRTGRGGMGAGIIAFLSLYERSRSNQKALLQLMTT